MKKYRLRNLLIDRADLVDKGANQEAFIELYKRDDSGIVDRVGEALERFAKHKHDSTDQSGHGNWARGGSKTTTGAPDYTPLEDAKGKDKKKPKSDSKPEPKKQSNASGTVVSEASGKPKSMNPSGKTPKIIEESDRARAKNLKEAQKLVDNGRYSDIDAAEKAVRRDKRIEADDKAAWTDTPDGGSVMDSYDNQEWKRLWADSDAQAADRGDWYDKQRSVIESGRNVRTPEQKKADRAAWTTGERMRHYAGTRPTEYVFSPEELKARGSKFSELTVMNNTASGSANQNRNFRYLVRATPSGGGEPVEWWAPTVAEAKLRAVEIAGGDEIGKWAQQEMTGQQFNKSTPGRRKALKALARAKKRNKARVAAGKNPIVEGKEVSRSSLSKQSGGPDVDKKKKRPAFLDGESEDMPEDEAPDDEMDDEEDKKKKLEKNLMDTLEAVTKGLIETDVFVDDATASDLRDMLPGETLSSIEEVLKSAGSAEPVGEAGMSEPSAVSATDLEELIEYVEKLEADIVDLEKRLVEPPEDADIAKALGELPADVADIVKADRAALIEARENLAKADIEKADREYVTKMNALPGIVDAPETFGPVLRQVAAFDADLAKAIEAVLVTANERITKGDLFTEAGNVGRIVGGDAMEKATNIAKSMVEASPGLSLEEARSRVWETNPDLYAEYSAEREAAK